jgi:hypothetical protein
LRQALLGKILIDGLIIAFMEMNLENRIIGMIQSSITNRVMETSPAVFIYFNKVEKKDTA